MKKGKILTPQQEKFLADYTNPKSPTFGNAYQSAINAGYGKEYAESLTSKDLTWLSENVGDLKRLQKAEEVLEKTLNYNPKNGGTKIDSRLLRTQTDVAKFIAERLNKTKYSTRQEHTGKDGDPLFDNEHKAKGKKAVREFIGGNS